MNEVWRFASLTEEIKQAHPQEYYNSAWWQETGTGTIRFVAYAAEDVREDVQARIAASGLEVVTEYGAPDSMGTVMAAADDLARMLSEAATAASGASIAPATEGYGLDVFATGPVQQVIDEWRKSSPQYADVLVSVIVDDEAEISTVDAAVQRPTGGE